MDSKQHLNDYINLNLSKLFIGGDVREYEKVDPSVSSLVVYPNVNYCWGPSANFDQIELSAATLTDSKFMKESDLMIYLDANTSATYGQNIDVKNELSAGNWNRCKIEWWNGIPTLYVIDAFFLTFKYDIPWPPIPEPDPEPDPTVRSKYTIIENYTIGSGIIIRTDIDSNGISERSPGYLNGYYEYQDGMDLWQRERGLTCEQSITPSGARKSISNIQYYI